MTSSVILHPRVIKTIAWMGVVALTMFIATYFYHYFFSTKQQPTQQLSDNIITNIDLIKTNQSGRMIYHFFSSKAKHYMAQNRTEFTKPKGYYYVEQQPYWQSRADHGKTVNGHETVHLFGHVYIHQDEGKNNHAVTLTTSKATLYPKKQIAENKVFVEVKQPDMIATSIGFYADLQQGKIILLSKARGYFLAKNKQQTEKLR